MKKLICLMMVMVSATWLSAAVVVNDTFDDGGRTDGADALDVAWYKLQNSTDPGGSTLTQLNPDAGSLASNAMEFRNITGANQRQFVGVMPATTLTNIGDSITLSVDFRLYGTTGTAATNGLRLGLFNSNGSVVSADGTGQILGGDNNIAASDKGYFGALSANMGTSATSRLAKQTGSGTTFMGGTSGITWMVSSTVTAGVSDLAKHNAQLTLTKMIDNVPAIPVTFIFAELYLDGNKILTGDDRSSSSLVTTFDEIGFSAGKVTDNFVIDNVVVSTIPEPATLALLGLGGLLFARKR